MAIQTHPGPKTNTSLLPGPLPPSASARDRRPVPPPFSHGGTCPVTGLQVQRPTSAEEPGHGQQQRCPAGGRGHPHLVRHCSHWPRRTPPHWAAAVSAPPLGSGRAPGRRSCPASWRRLRHWRRAGGTRGAAPQSMPCSDRGARRCQPAATVSTRARSSSCWPRGQRQRHLCDLAPPTGCTRDTCRLPPKLDLALRFDGVELGVSPVFCFAGNEVLSGQCI